MQFFDMMANQYWGLSLSRAVIFANGPNSPAVKGELRLTEWLTGPRLSYPIFVDGRHYLIALTLYKTHCNVFDFRASAKSRVVGNAES